MEAVTVTGPTASLLQISKLTNVAIVRLCSLDRNLPPTGPVQALPTEVGTINARPPASLCVRPGEWLLIDDRNEPETLLAMWQDCTENGRFAAFDQSDGTRILRLQGEAAPWLLSKLSGLDFQRHAESGAHCARTRLGQLAVTVYARPETNGTVFDLLVGRSYEHYLAELLDASSAHARELAQEFGDFA